MTNVCIEEGQVSKETQNTRATDKKDFNLTDVGNAERLVARFGQDIHWQPKCQSWLCWNGKRWEIDEDLEIERKAKATIRSIYLEISELESEISKTCGDVGHLRQQVKRLRQHAERSESKPRIDALVSLTKSEPGITISNKDLDADCMLLNTLSGTIDLRTGQLRKHERNDLMTKMVPFPFADINARSKLWERFINDIMCGDQEMVDYLQRCIGYALTGRTDEQCLFLMYGMGSNGKSTFIEAIRAVLGDYSQQAEFKTFLEQEGDKVRNDIARMVGVRFLSATEGPQGKRLSEDTVKNLTGSDTITTRFLFREYFEFEPTHKIFLATNHKPTIVGVDNGIWRRLRVLPFEACFSDDKKDPKLLEKLKAEAPAILAWAVRGCLVWQAQGLGMPKAVEAATQEYRAEMDKIQAFIDECCTKNPHATVGSQELYDEYRRWAEANGYSPLNIANLSLTLAEKGFKKKHTNKGNRWEGIGLSNLVTGVTGVTQFSVKPPHGANSSTPSGKPVTPFTPVTHQDLKPGEDLVFSL